jgi:hypothetical protein
MRFGFHSYHLPSALLPKMCHWHIYLHPMGNQPLPFGNWQLLLKLTSRFRSILDARLHCGRVMASVLTNDTAHCLAAKLQARGSRHMQNHKCFCAWLVATANCQCSYFAYLRICTAIIIRFYANVKLNINIFANFTVYKRSMWL